MRKKYLSLVLLLLFPFFSISQSYCELPGVKINSKRGTLSNKTQIVNDFYTIRVFLHTICKSDGSGGQSNAVKKNVINSIAEDFRQLNICLSILGSDEIHNDNIYGFGKNQLYSRDLNNNLIYDSQGYLVKDNDNDGKFDQLNINSHQDAIDIYLFPNNSSISGGTTSNIPGTAFVIGGTLSSLNLVNTKAVSHELGHCLGLYHTFHGTECEPGNGIIIDDESDYDSTGDLVHDTPIDLNTKISYVNSSCVWNFIGCKDQSVDRNLYNPDMQQIMSYTRLSCLQRFSSGQGRRMRNMIAKIGLLNNIIVPNDFEMLQQSFTNGENLTYEAQQNFISNNEVVINPNAQVIFRAGSSIVLKSGFLAKERSDFLAKIGLECDEITNNLVAKSNYNSEEKEEDISNSSIDELVSVFPNPTISSINILSKVKIKSIVVFSIDGKIIENREVNNQMEFNIDVIDYARGIYFIAAEDENGVVKKLKFIKN